MKRILLFLATNLAVMVVLSTVVRLLGLERYLHGTGGLGGLLVFAAIFGFGGAIISLLISKWMAKRSMGVQVIDQPRNAAEQWLVATVQRAGATGGHRHARGGRLQFAGARTPSPPARAATTRSSPSAPACSRRWIAARSRPCSRHEVSHVANGDMVTLTLIQGVVNTFVIFLARIIGNIVDGFAVARRRAPGAAAWPISSP